MLSSSSNTNIFQLLSAFTKSKNLGFWFSGTQKRGLSAKEKNPWDDAGSISFVCNSDTSASNHPASTS